MKRGARGSRWLIWLTLLVAAPVPLFGIGSGRVPPLHQLELGVLALAFTLLERAQGIGPLLSGLFLGQALAWAAALWLVAWLVSRGLEALPPLTRRRATLLLVGLGLAFASAQPLYRTPYSAHTAHSSLWQVYR